MIINVYCPLKDKQFCLHIGPDLKVEEFKELCSTESGISTSAMRLFFNSEPLSDNKKTLTSYKVNDNDMIVLEAEAPPTRPAQAIIPPIDFSGIQVPGRTAASQPAVASMGNRPRLPTTQGRPLNPQIDFSQVRVPAPNHPSSSTSPVSSANHAPFGHSMSDHVAFRKLLLDNPRNLEMVRKMYAPVVDAMLSGSEELYIEEFFKFGEILKRQQPLRSADPMDIEVQKRIAEEIERKNIDENMTMAMEQNPESFAQVVMLWINLKVNGHHVKAFVDSGAQMTIMSAECAQRCNIMRLVDRRWEGVAKGVGTQKIMGRIHLAQIQIEDVFLQCSFSVLEDQPMEVLLGLDMLRRHLCVIDLRENSLVIGTNNTKTSFLSEAELPSYGRLHDPNAPPSVVTDTPKEGGQVTFCSRRQTSSSKSETKKSASKTSRPPHERSASNSDENENNEQQEPTAKVRKTEDQSKSSRD